MAKNKDNEEAKNKKINPIVMILLLIIVIGAGTFAGTYLFMKNNSNEEAKPIKEVKVPVLEELTVNINEASKKYVKATVYISYDEENKDIAQEITDKSIEIQDKTALFLRSKTADEFNSDNTNKLKQELISEINSLLVEGKIVNIYFPKGLVVQQ